MAKRGFFAELNYQAQQAEKRSRQQQNANHRAQVAAERDAERYRKAAERSRAAASRASAADQKAAEKEAARLHVESRMAEVEAMNANLASELADVDSLLAWTLDVDDFVDLQTLKVGAAEHPPFDPGPLGTPAAAIPEPDLPPEPRYQEPPAPSGLSSAFGGKKRHQAAIELATATYESDHEQWVATVAAATAQHARSQARRDASEVKRLEKLGVAEEKYRKQCAQRDEEARQQDAQVDQLVNDLAFDVESAIEEYIGIVLSNSVYPEAFAVEYDYRFDLVSRELILTVEMPDPSAVPAVKEYRYVKSKDEITSTALTMKAQKDRYAGAVWQVAVRTIHEIFEADREGKINSIALTVSVNRISPATGRPEQVPLVVVSAERSLFDELDLTNVVPDATLAHLGAAMSKSPFDLTPADTSRGVRVRGQ